jgi:hypothetical protein
MQVKKNRTNITNYMFCYFILFFLINENIFCQNSTSAINTLNSQSLEYDGIFGVGWGVFAIIMAAFFGICCCIFGSTTLYPAIFVTIGFCLPISTLIFMSLAPLSQPEVINLKDNPATNPIIIVKWVVLIVLILSFVGLLLPYMCIWNKMIIPQRVDSRAQREYYEKYEKLIEEEKEKIEKEKEKEKDNKQLAMGEQEKADVMLQINNNIPNNISQPYIENQNAALGGVNIGQAYMRNDGDNIASTVKKVKNLTSLRRRKEAKQDDNKID